MAQEDDAAAGRMIKDGEIPSTGDKERRPIVIGDQLYIKAYAEPYTGRTKINRLRFIADKCGSPWMELEALKMAYDEIKKGEDTQVFKEVVKKINGRLGATYGPDNVWADAADRRAELREEKLKNDLDSYKASSIIESIRKGYNALGDLYYARGHLGEAFVNYGHECNYCSTADHIVDMYLGLILVSIDMGVFPLVRLYALEALSRGALHPNTIAKLQCAAGLAELKDRKYNLAAHKFLLSSPTIGNSYSEVIAPRDIATYGGLCALASFDYAELKSKVIEDKDFQKFLKMVPKIWELINNFSASY